MYVEGGSDKFFSLLILSGRVKDFFFLPPRGAFMLGLPVFHILCPFLVSRMFVAVVTEKLTTNVKL